MGQKTGIGTRRVSIGFAAGVVATSLVLGGGIALASIPSSTTGTITACVNHTSGATRIIDYQAGTRCVSTESTINWSKGYRQRGAWGSTVSYAVLDVVSYGGSSYVATVPSLGKTPTADIPASGTVAVVMDVTVPPDRAVERLSHQITYAVAPDAPARSLIGSFTVD